MKIILKGEKYKGVFEGGRDSYEGETSGDHYVSGSKYFVYWYSGTGVIHKKKSKERYFFNFCGDSFQFSRDDPGDLASALINFGKPVYEYFGNYQLNTLRTKLGKQIIPERFPKLVDLVLEEIVSQVRESEEEIPKVKLKKLNMHELVQRGFLYDEKGEVRTLMCVS